MLPDVIENRNIIILFFVCIAYLALVSSFSLYNGLVFSLKNLNNESLFMISVLWSSQITCSYRITFLKMTAKEKSILHHKKYTTQLELGMLFFNFFFYIFIFLL